ncbi:hypothetical protein [Lacrimispora xylanisolvens]|uniref:hypothetical protein n=1 Tax=Lacrimispora xylanisolvens TaxID=384636 RepID=UPI0032E8027E
MRDLIKRVPVPMSGVMLGCAALGNLLQSYSESIRYVFGIISFLLLMLLVLKITMYPSDVKEDLKNPNYNERFGYISYGGYAAISLHKAFLESIGFNHLAFGHSTSSPSYMCLHLSIYEKGES